jgi:hypothetical protein
VIPYGLVCGGFAFADRFGLPLHVVFEEDLDGVAAGFDAAFDGAVEPAGNGHVGPEWNHDPMIDAVQTSENQPAK